VTAFIQFDCVCAAWTGGTGGQLRGETRRCQEKCHRYPSFESRNGAWGVKTNIYIKTFKIFLKKK